MFQGEATHVFDAVLLFQNFNDELPPAMRAAAERFATDVLTFCEWAVPLGGAGWGGQGVKVYGLSSWDAEVVEPTAKIVDDVVSSVGGAEKCYHRCGVPGWIRHPCVGCGSFMSS